MGVPVPGSVRNRRPVGIGIRCKPRHRQREPSLGEVGPPCSGAHEIERARGQCPYPYADGHQGDHRHALSGKVCHSDRSLGAALHGLGRGTEGLVRLFRQGAPHEAVRTGDPGQEQYQGHADSSQRAQQGSHRLRPETETPRRASLPSVRWFVVMGVESGAGPSWMGSG
jgi:hypothetical protein